MKKVVLIAVLLAVALCAAPVWSQGGPPRGGPHGGGMAIQPPPPAAMIDPITAALSLTADQAASLKAILTDADAAIPPLQQAARDAGKALRDAVFSTSADSTASVDELIDAAQAAQKEVTVASITAWDKIKAILTADQFAKLAAGPGPGGPPPSDSGGSSTQSRGQSRRK